MNNLKSFFDPKSVAVIGASATQGRPGRTVIENMIANGYAGRIHPVNPRGGEICGRQTSKSILDLPEGVDMGIVMLPAASTPQAVADCAAKGMSSVVLAAGGFAEVDHAGEDLQAELRAVIKSTGVRVLGPNTAGHISTPANFTSSFFPLGDIPKGPISYIAQTGNFTGAMMRSIMTGEHYGVARCIGLGNAVDIDEADVLEYLADDDETDAIFIYLESLHRPAAFLKTARRITRKKPIIMLKGGATADGAKAAMSHTASLGADDRVLDGALAQAGIVRIEEFTQLFTVAKAAAMMPVPRGPRVGFVSPSGAFIVHASDICKTRTILEFSKIAPATLSRLKEISPPFIDITNPVDIFPSATVHGMEFAWREAMAALLRDPKVDSLVAILILADELGPMKLDFIVDLAAEYPEKPIYISFSGDENSNAKAKSFLEPLGVPTFPRIEDPFKVLDIMARARAAMTS
jgi:acetate---CoA ligase (ADP-forming)